MTDLEMIVAVLDRNQVEYEREQWRVTRPDGLDVPGVELVIPSGGGAKQEGYAGFLNSLRFSASDGQLMMWGIWE